MVWYSTSTMAVTANPTITEHWHTVLSKLLGRRCVSGYDSLAVWNTKATTVPKRSSIKQPGVAQPSVAPNDGADPGPIRTPSDHFNQSRGLRALLRALL